MAAMMLFIGLILIFLGYAAVEMDMAILGVPAVGIGFFLMMMWLWDVDLVSAF